MTHSLTLGSLRLTGVGMPDPDDDFVLDVLADGMGFGVAQGAREVVRTLLADGDKVRITRYGNREVTFKVEITGPSLAAVAAGEAALRRETASENELTWQAPDVLAAPTVFEVVTSEMQQVFDDLDELRSRRTFTVTLTCSPWARSAEAVTVEALPSGSTTVTFDTCDSTVGWSATRSGSPTGLAGWIAGAIGAAELDNEVTSPETWSMTRTGSVDFSSTRYLVAEIQTISYSKGVRVSAFADGHYLPVLSVRAIPDGSGFSQIIFDAKSAGTATSITFYHSSLAGEPWQGIFIRDLARSNISPNIGVRQQTRILEVGGTERSPASIHVASADGESSLGLAIVHTCPEDGSGYSPPLRRWRVSGQDAPPSSDALSGATESITGTGATYEIPTNALPEGGYVLAARAARSIIGPAKFAWSTATVFPDGVTVQGEVGGVETITFGDINSWNIIGITVLSLPSVRTMSGKVRIILQDTTGSGDTSLDEAWLFRLGDDCGLTITNTSYPNLWLDSPGIDGPVPRVSVGNDRATRVHPGIGLQCMNTHILSPTGTSVFTAALSDHPMTDATFFRLWHSNAAS